jgi:hypothetical protein
MHPGCRHIDPQDVRVDVSFSTSVEIPIVSKESGETKVCLDNIMQLSKSHDLTREEGRMCHTFAKSLKHLHSSTVGRRTYDVPFSDRVHMPVMT